MDRLAAMEAFVRVVDVGSFSGAAGQLRFFCRGAGDARHWSPTGRASLVGAAPYILKTIIFCSVISRIVQGMPPMP